MALTPGLSNQVLRIQFPSRALSYGFEKVRFLSPVRAGARVRLFTKSLTVEEHQNGTLIRLEHTMETDFEAKPALVAVRLTLALAETT